MIKFGKGVVKFRVPIVILSFLLLVPAVIGYVNTRINYDILSYLPGDIETMQGQDILLEEFGTGAFSVAVVEGMEQKDVVALKSEICQIDHVKSVLWYDSLADPSIPMELLPGDLQEAFENKEKNTTLMIVMLDTSMSADETLDAVEQIRGLTSQKCLLSGMSAVVADIKKICNSEALMYVAIASGLSAVVLSLTMDSFLIPLFFLLSIEWRLFIIWELILLPERFHLLHRRWQQFCSWRLRWIILFFSGTATRRTRSGFREIKSVPWLMRSQIRFHLLLEALLQR